MHKTFFSIKKSLGINMHYCVIFVTVKNIEEAKNISRKILEDKMAACVNIVPSIDSLYWWEGKIVEDNEALMIIKTTHKAVEKSYLL